MRRATFIVIGFVTLMAPPESLVAAVLPSPTFANETEWYLPGGMPALVIETGSSVAAKVSVPPLTPKEVAAGGAWRGVMAVDLFGSPAGAGGGMRVELVEPDSGKVLMERSATVGRIRAPQAKWAAVGSSEHPGSEVAKAFDGKSETIWHSRYGEEQSQPPHWIGLIFSSPRKLNGVRLQPRQTGFTNGVPRQWRLEVRDAANGWRQVASGESDRKVVADARKPIEVHFESPPQVEGVRFVIESDWSGGGFGTAAELELLGVTLEESEPAATPQARVWLELPPKSLEKVTGKELELRLTGVSGRVVVGEPRWCRVNTQPCRKLFGRSNGGLGPDKLGAGLLGFTALTEHRQTVLSVMEVRQGGPSDKAGLRSGDGIIAVAGEPLPENDLSPGWTWFRQSHEAVLGRAIEAALTNGEKSLELTVLRDGNMVAVPVRLLRERAFTTMNPADDPQAAALLGDLLDWITKNQRADGSWSGDIKRTTFAALALLATGEKQHEQRVKRAIDWALATFDEPRKHGNLGFWGGSYMGILYAEWHLRTGDQRVLPPLDAMRDWAFEGRHPSLWGVPALGHGPSGLPYGQKSLVAPACHLLLFEALAQQCGMESKLWEMLAPYMEMAWSAPAEGGHGALGYNKSYKDLGEFWSRSGLFAMACHLRGEKAAMRDGMIQIMVKRHPWLRNSHAYGEPGGGLGLLALQLVAPDAYEQVIREYAWWFALAWEPGYGLKFTQPHMGAPYMGEDDLLNVVYALVLQSPRRNLTCTGRQR